MSSRPDDFPQNVKDALAKRVGFRCSSPKCRQLTSGPHTDGAKAVNVGVASHISAAQPGGPRYDPTMSSSQRRSIENGIWLCELHAKHVDTDPVEYNSEILHLWKTLAEAEARRDLESPGDRQAQADPRDPRGLPWEFRTDAGVWRDPASSLHYCPKCRAAGIPSPLKVEDHGFRCGVCDNYFNDPARPREASRGGQSPRGPLGWMAN